MAINIALALASLSAAASGLFVVFRGTPVEASLTVFGASLAVILTCAFRSSGAG
jgi:hypothetical protein